jgi:hypothetical protein
MGVYHQPLPPIMIFFGINKLTGLPGLHPRTANLGVVPPFYLYYFPEIFFHLIISLPFFAILSSEVCHPTMKMAC